MFREKERANSILRYAISLCQGKGCKCPDNVRLSLILRLKDDLAGMGAVWQVKCLQWHLHKFQQEFMTTTIKRKEVSKKIGGDVLVWYKHIP